MRKLMTMRAKSWFDQPYSTLRTGASTLSVWRSM
jgi:hypothetical protein